MLASFALVGCLAISSGATHVVVADLAPAIPEFASLPADTPLALAPVPGVVRTFRVPDLRSIFTKFAIAAEPKSEICVTRPVAVLTPERLLASMQKLFPEARIEIADFSRQPAPEGEVEFALTGLHYSEPLSLWTGSIRYAGNLHFSIWARAKIRQTVTRVVAVSELKPGQAIEAAQLRADTRDAFPQLNVYATRVEDVAGKCARVAIRAGADIPTALLEPPKEVWRGDTVRVIVESGGAQLELEAVAETSGAAGQTVLVRNPLSQKQFRAVVEGRNKVRVSQ